MKTLRDRDISYGKDVTISWAEFSESLFGSQVTDMGRLLNHQVFLLTEEGERIPTMGPATIARSIIKLHTLGVLQYDFVTTVGITSPNYIDRFHITLFGQKVLEYIDINDYLPSP